LSKKPIREFSKRLKENIEVKEIELLLNHHPNILKIVYRLSRKNNYMKIQIL
jgi:hypothetical protein